MDRGCAMDKARRNLTGDLKSQYCQWLRASSINSNGAGDKRLGGSGSKTQIKANQGMGKGEASRTIIL